MQRVDGFWLTIFLSGTVILALTGCRQAPTGPVQTSSPNQSANTQPGETGKQVDQGDLKFRYQPRRNPSAATNHPVGANPQAIEQLITELNQRLILPFDIDISIADCGEPDAYYDPDAHLVTICHQLIDEYYSLFARKIKETAKLDAAVRSATAATFFHELGHALVDAWKIPITGREEDAVDQLSTLVLIETAEDGEQMTLAGAESFKLYADLTRGKKKIYWDEHSFDEQRFYDTICLLYGHDEEKFAYLVANGTLPEERSVFCADDYERVSRAWRQLLSPYLKYPPKTGPRLKLR